MNPDSQTSPPAPADDPPAPARPNPNTTQQTFKQPDAKMMSGMLEGLLTTVMVMTLEMSMVNGHKQAIMRETVKLPYEVNDLEGRCREELVAIVQQQAKKWPYHDSKHCFTMKTNMDQMCCVLLNCMFGFTKEMVVTRHLSPAPSTPRLSGSHQYDGTQVLDSVWHGLDGPCSPPLIIH
ncbi:hypothetical protein JVT61DRAFT_3332 [Boletus reticuloceps]|uniref:Uncharacterized protein n=1 Tax=Boletus reticuloceps TaxID=495285 RepID=A0A8I2YLT7_9AGAM|nr:hypothetical protein JVT61DRAFT_3332 [Boletus reticuloceps]